MSQECIYTKKDFVSNQEVKWCPGCGDYAVLSSVQIAMSKMNKKKEDFVCVSGIGCSSRFPYYMNTYGYHTIHGRAPAIATGIKVANPDLSVWVITGDGDGFSIGGNHMIHTLRRNVDLNIILFNNQIYGLTKGQYSPTSKRGKITKSSPFGAVDREFNPCGLAIGAGGTFVARTMDTDPKHMTDLFIESSTHLGTSFVEILQNCVIFNDKVHDKYTNKSKRDESTIQVFDGKPMLFGADKKKGIVLENLELKVIDINSDQDLERVLVHNSSNRFLASMLAYMGFYNDLPLAIGVLYRENGAPIYDQDVNFQVKQLEEKKGRGKMQELLHSGETWRID